jgi:chloramphenicol 3-O-phosphotransferase
MIILINGSINSGKTTVAKALTGVLPQTAHVEVDALREFVGFLPLHEAIPVSLENAVAVTRNLVARHFHVVLTYPLGQEDYDYLLASFADLGGPIHTFTLSPALEVALTDRGERRLTDYERRRIREQYAAGRHHPPFGICIDTTSHTPDETATAIIAHIHTQQKASSATSA